MANTFHSNLWANWAPLCLCIIVSLTSFQSDEKAKGMIFVNIIPTFNGDTLKLNDKQYVTSFGDTISIEEFKIYMSNIKFKSDKRHTCSERNSAHLLDADDLNSLRFLLSDVVVGNYVSMTFDIGVDSFLSVSGIHEGDLDPSKGMYWAWNTGYINAKLQGHSKSCKTLHNAFEFHIGGYMPPFKSLRNVKLTLPNIKVFSEKSTEIVIYMDAAAWFDKPHKISLAQTNKVVMPGKDALQIADNYKDMFSLKH